MQDLRLHPEPALKQNKLKQTSVFPSRWDQAVATAVYRSLSEGRSQKCEQQCEKWLSCFTTVLLSDLLEGFIRLHNRLHSWLRLFYRGYRVKAARKIYALTDMTGPAKALMSFLVWGRVGVLSLSKSKLQRHTRNLKWNQNVHHQTWCLCQGTEQAITAWAIVPGAKSWNQ